MVTLCTRLVVSDLSLIKFCLASHSFIFYLIIVVYCSCLFCKTSAVFKQIGKIQTENFTHEILGKFLILCYSKGCK